MPARTQHARGFGQCLVHGVQRHVVQRLEHQRQVEGPVGARDCLRARRFEAHAGRGCLQIALVLYGIHLQAQVVQPGPALQHLPCHACGAAAQLNDARAGRGQELGKEVEFVGEEGRCHGHKCW